MQRGQILERGRWWVLRFRETVLVDGRPARKLQMRRLAPRDREHRTEASVRALADAILAPVNARQGDPQSVDTVARFFENLFLPHCRQTRKPSTFAGYANIWRLIRGTGFARIQMRAVRTADVHALLEHIAAVREWSRNSLSNIRGFLSAGFRYAQNVGQVASNPVSAALTPKGKAPVERHAYTLAEISAMVAALDEPAKTLVLTAALTGLRRSELAALQWDDFRGDTLTVRRAYWKGSVSTTKTEASAGSVPVLPMLREALDAHRRRNGYDAWCFHGATGKPLRLDNVARNKIAPRLAARGLEWKGWHAFRHGLATNLAELGAPVKVAQSILRHANLNVTLRHYVHARREQTTEAMRKLEDAFRKARKLA